MVLRLPRGRYYLSRVHYAPKGFDLDVNYFLHEDFATVDLRSAGQVAYIGHLRFDWKGPMYSYDSSARDAGAIMGAVTGGLLGGLVGMGVAMTATSDPSGGAQKLDLWVEDHLHDLEGVIGAKYPDLGPAVKHLLRLKDESVTE